MKQLVALFCSLLQFLFPMHEALSAQEMRAALAMHTGVTLRMHVIAQDDTEAMQQIKLAVRDGVQQAYRTVSAGQVQPMLTVAHRHIDALTAVGIEFYSVFIGCPPGVQGYSSAICGCQILNRFSCGIVIAASIGGCVPAGEGIAKLTELVGIQLLCLIIGKVLVIHLTAAAIGIECPGVCIGCPLGIQGKDTAGCQILNALHIFIGCAASVGDCVPAGKGIACLAVRVGI